LYPVASTWKEIAPCTIPIVAHERRENNRTCTIIIVLADEWHEINRTWSTILIVILLLPKEQNHQGNGPRFAATGCGSINPTFKK
jgi:abortive infection bacteriophage resistance protein